MSLLQLFSLWFFTNYILFFHLRSARNKKTEVKPVLHNWSPYKIYMKFNITNTLTKTSCIFKGMSKPNSSSFWSYNKTNKFYSQLLYHMLLMTFIPHQANSLFEENATTQRHVTVGTFLTICQFLATASSEIRTGSWMLIENNGHAAYGFSGINPDRIVKNTNYFLCELLEVDPWNDSQSPQLSFPKASRYNTFTGRICLMTICAYVSSTK